MDYSLLVGIHNCDATDQQLQQLHIGDDQTADVQCAVGNSSDEHDSSGSAGTPPESPLALRRNRTVSFNAELDPCLELFAIKCAECELMLLNDNYLTMMS